MTLLRNRSCTPCPPGTPALGAEAAASLLRELDPRWELGPDGRSLRGAFRFPDFHHTMSFVNAVAWVANQQDHHPDLEVGYDYCRMSFSTHSIGGLSENDFICAARVDALGAG
jgi:4a-hydroxytetrahydrobiopterin dehydratase